MIDLCNMTHRCSDFLENVVNMSVIQCAWWMSQILYKTKWFQPIGYNWFFIMASISNYPSQVFQTGTHHSVLTWCNILAWYTRYQKDNRFLFITLHDQVKYCFCKGIKSTESLWYLTDVTAVSLWGHQPNMNMIFNSPVCKVHLAYMGPTWGWQHPCGPHVGPMILAIWEVNNVLIILKHDCFTNLKLN